MNEIPTEALEAAARALWSASGWSPTAFDHPAEGRAREAYRRTAGQVMAAAAPFLVAEGRRQASEQIFAPKASEFSVAFDDDGPFIDETPSLMARYERELRAKIAAEIRAGMGPGKQMPSNMRHAPWWSSLSGPYPAGYAEWAARLAEGLSPADRAERQLRASRERQAGLDYDRIERARVAEETDHGD